MATKTIQGMNIQQFGGIGMALYGNITGYVYGMETKANGSVVDADSTTAIADGDEVILGVLPQGMMLHDSLLIVSDAFTAATVAKIGFRYADGLNDTVVPNDDDYFGSALVLNAVGRLRNATTNKPVKLAREALLVLTSSGAAHASVGRLDFIVYGERFGPK